MFGWTMFGLTWQFFLKWIDCNCYILLSIYQGLTIGTHFKDKDCTKSNHLLRIINKNYKSYGLLKLKITIFFMGSN
jgi:hypothetical protein